MRFFTRKRMVTDHAFMFIGSMDTLLGGLEVDATDAEHLFTKNGWAGVHMTIHAISQFCAATVQVAQEEGAVTDDFVAYTTEVLQRLQKFHVLVIDAEKRDDLLFTDDTGLLLQ